MKNKKFEILVSLPQLTKGKYSVVISFEDRVSIVKLTKNGNVSLFAKRSLIDKSSLSRMENKGNMVWL